MTEQRIGADEPGLTAYVAAVASAAPTPGGGSVAAVVGALAAALGEMVVNLTVGRPAAADESDLRRALDALGAARRTLFDLAVEDERAYSSYLAATALPKSTPADQAARTEARQAALVRAAEAPQRVATICLGLFPILNEIARIGNRHVLADAAVAAILAEAAVRAAVVNVRVNARAFRDPALAEVVLRSAVAAETEARASARGVLDSVEGR